MKETVPVINILRYKTYKQKKKEKKKRVLF